MCAVVSFEGPRMRFPRPSPPTLLLTVHDKKKEVYMYTTCATDTGEIACCQLLATLRAANSRRVATLQATSGSCLTRSLRSYSTRERTTSSMDTKIHCGGSWSAATVRVTLFMANTHECAAAASSEVELVRFTHGRPRFLSMSCVILGKRYAVCMRCRRAGVTTPMCSNFPLRAAARFAA